MSQPDPQTTPDGMRPRIFTVRGQYCYWVTSDGPSVDITSDDARLFNASSDLLAALEAVVSVADRKTVEFDQARAAIAKARGVQDV